MLAPCAEVWGFLLLARLTQPSALQLAAAVGAAVPLGAHCWHRAQSTFPSCCWVLVCCMQYGSRDTDVVDFIFCLWTADVSWRRVEGMWAPAAVGAVVLSACLSLVLLAGGCSMLIFFWLSHLLSWSFNLFLHSFLLTFSEALEESVLKSLAQWWW